jgi:alpha-L-fucosidase
LYAITLGKPVEKTFIRSLGQKAGAGVIASVEMVGSGEKVKWAQRADALEIEPSAGYPSEDAVVYKIGFRKL